MLSGQSLAFTPAVWAKGPKKQEAAAPQEKSYLAPYGLVALGVLLGMIIVCRPARRADEPKPRSEEE